MYFAETSSIPDVSAEPAIGRPTGNCWDFNRGRRPPLSESGVEKLKTAFHAMAERLLQKGSTPCASLQLWTVSNVPACVDAPL